MRKSSSTVKLLAITALVLTVLILAPVGSQAQTVIRDPGNSLKAIGIRDLNVNGTFYDVEFLWRTPAIKVYGGPPGVFDFTTQDSAGAAVEAVNAALNTAGVTFVGSEGSPVDFFSEAYFIGWSMGPSIGPAPTVNTESGGHDPPWTGPVSDPIIYTDGRTYAVFTPTGPPEPVDEVTIGGSVFFLEGSGLVLQNNGGDDETINAPGGDFTFNTPLAVGSTYEVTVKTQPSNPDQECTVARGSGTVPTQDVTNVLVVCGPFDFPGANTGFLPAVYLLLGAVP